MKTFKSVTILSAALALGLGAVACSNDDPSDVDGAGGDNTGGTASGGAPNGTGGLANLGGNGGEGGADSGSSILQLLSADSDYSMLVEAVTAAGLVDALSDDDLTVFAPDNAAMEELLDDLDLDSVSDLTQAQLRPILLYHVLDHVVSSTEAKALAPGDGKGTSLGGKYELALDGSDLLIDEATVTMADVQATNGVIHYIDSVLLPSITDIVTTDPSLSGLKGWIVDADGTTDSTPKLALVLDANADIDGPIDGKWTVFAPNNLAVSGLSTPPSGQDLTNVLAYHTVTSLFAVTFMEALDFTNDSFETSFATHTVVVDGDSADTVTVSDENTTSDDATVKVADIYAANGIIHIIDEVLLPVISD